MPPLPPLLSFGPANNWGIMRCYIRCCVIFTTIRMQSSFKLSLILDWKSFILESFFIVLCFPFLFFPKGKCPILCLTKYVKILQISIMRFKKIKTITLTQVILSNIVSFSNRILENNILLLWLHIISSYLIFFAWKTFILKLCTSLSYVHVIHFLQQFCMYVYSTSCIKQHFLSSNVVYCANNNVIAPKLYKDCPSEVTWKYILKSNYLLFFV